MTKENPPAVAAAGDDPEIKILTESEMKELPKFHAVWMPNGKKGNGQFGAEYIGYDLNGRPFVKCSFLIDHDPLEGKQPPPANGKAHTPAEIKEAVDGELVELIKTQIHWRQNGSPLFWELAEVAVAWTEIHAEYEPLLGRTSSIDGDIPERDDATFENLMRSQNDLVRRVEKLLLAKPETAMCLYIKAGLLGIFTVFSERESQYDHAHPEMEYQPSDASLVEAVFQLGVNVGADTSNEQASGIEHSIDAIEKSLI